MNVKNDFYLEMYTPIFEHVFETQYSKGYFGDVDKMIIKQQQWDWFATLVEMIISGDTESLLEVLERVQYKITRIYFSHIVGKNIVREVTDTIMQDIKDSTEEY